MDELQRLRSDVDRLQRQMGDVSNADQRTAIGAVSLVDPQPIVISPPAPPAANQIRNGDGSHSVNTWFDTVAAPGTDKVKEAAHWFSNDAPATGQLLDFTNAETSSANKTLKTTAHSTYNGLYCDWSVPAGVMRLTGTKSLDAPFPNNSVFPSRPMYLGAIIALRDSTTRVRPDTRLAAMLYDNDASVKDFMKAGAAFHLSGDVRFRTTPPAATTERRYKVLAETDRGYSFLSDELVIANAPTDPSYISGEIDVYLSWEQITGVLRYKVYRHNIVAGTFDFLKEITSGSNTYGDNNNITTPGVVGYPAATFDRVTCYVATLTGALSTLPVDGIALKWASLFLNIPVPSSLATSGSGNQVLRVALTTPLDREVDPASSTAASTQVQTATDQFTALDTGRTATLYAADGTTVLHGPGVITFNTTKIVDFATPVSTTHADAILFIEEGGDHGLLMDMIHIGYLSRAAYAPYFEDLNRTLPSTAAPNTSSQGGVGPGGDTGDPGDGGIGGCIEISVPVTTLFGNNYRDQPFEMVSRGQALKSGNHTPNWVNDVVISKTDNLHVVRTANGLELPCSLGQVFFTSTMDTQGRSLSRLRVGDFILTCFDDRDECSRITEILATGRSAKVGSYALEPGHKYLAGRLRLPWWKRLIRWAQGRRGICKIYIHNLKPQRDLGP